MQIVDTLYGTVNVSEPLLLDLLDSAAVKRLKHLHQYGIPDAYYPFPNYFRYEHVVGTMLLLRRLGANVPEQAAGLLHDVSNLAFSHVADWVFGAQETEDFQDTLRASSFERSGIAQILRAHGMSSELLIDLAAFPLLERPAPDLCADRIDYTLRDLRVLDGSIDVPYYLGALKIFEGQVVFTSAEVAERFALGLLRLGQAHYASRDIRLRYLLWSQMLRCALQRGIIIKEDFWLDDAAVLRKLEQSNDGDLLQTLREFTMSPLRPEVVKQYASRPITKKFRYVDPPILVRGTIARLSTLSLHFIAALEHARRVHSKGGTT